MQAEAGRERQGRGVQGEGKGSEGMDCRRDLAARRRLFCSGQEETSCHNGEQRAHKNSHDTQAFGHSHIPYVTTARK